MNSVSFHGGNSCGIRSFRSKTQKGINRMFQSVNLLAVSCLFLTVESQTGKISKPQNLSVTWISEFKPQLSWAPPQHSMTGCRYKVSSETREEYSCRVETQGITTSPWTIDRDVVMNGGFLQLSVEANCSGNISEKAVINVTYPDLVKSWSCYIYSREKSHCSWETAPDAPRIRFYYRLVTEVPKSTDNGSSPIQECPSYSNTKDRRPGCDLQAGLNHSILILFNGTQNNTLFRSTFKVDLLNDVRPPPLNWTVHKTGDKFNITWSPPEIGDLSEWTFSIKYTECNENKTIQKIGETSLQLPRVGHCPYRMNIKAIKKPNKGESPWSEEKHFDADTGPNASIYAAIIIPLMFAGLAALTFVCCRKNKENIFPKVPQPRDLLSDVSDNNNKSTVCNLYIPASEEENCKITLVIDPQVNKPDC